MPLVPLSKSYRHEIMQATLSPPELQSTSIIDIPVQISSEKVHPQTTGMSLQALLAIGVGDDLELSVIWE